MCIYCSQVQTACDYCVNPAVTLNDNVGLFFLSDSRNHKGCRFAIVIIIAFLLLYCYISSIYVHNCELCCLLLASTCVCALCFHGTKFIAFCRAELQ